MVGKLAGSEIRLASCNNYGMKITLLNTSILTAFGTYEYKPLSLEQARILATENKTASAIGHAATAEILSDLLGVIVPANRIEFSQASGEVALIFKLKSRIPEGVVLDRDGIEAIGYEFGLLRRTS